MNGTHAPSRESQRGFSIVELMVGMAIGLFLLIGLSQMFLNTRSATRHEENLARMQESGRIAIELLSREIRKVGYVSNPIQEREIIFPAANGFTAGTALTGTTTTISLRFQGSGTVSGDAIVQTCQGSNVLATDLAYQTLTVTVTGTDDLPSLRCATSVVPTAVPGTPTTSGAQALVPNVEAINIMAGLDTTGDLQPDRYVDPATVADWSQVSSLNIQVRLVSTDNFLADAPQAYRAFDGTLVTPADRRLRRVYGSVLTLRNLVL